MWLVLGISAIIFAILNIIWVFRDKNAKWFRFLSVSLTALTVCSFYADGAARVLLKKIGEGSWILCLL